MNCISSLIGGTSGAVRTFSTTTSSSGIVEEVESSFNQSGISEEEGIGSTGIDIAEDIGFSSFSSTTSGVSTLFSSAEGYEGVFNQSGTHAVFTSSTF